MFVNLQTRFQKQNCILKFHIITYFPNKKIVNEVALHHLVSILTVNDHVEADKLIKRPKSDVKHWEEPERHLSAWVLNMNMLKWLLT